MKFLYNIYIYIIIISENFNIISKIYTTSVLIANNFNINYFLNNRTKSVRKNTVEYKSLTIIDYIKFIHAFNIYI